jgi:hypothetical protein
MKRITHHLILITLYTAPVLLAFWAGTCIERGNAAQAMPLAVLAFVSIASVYGRGIQLERRCEELEPFAPTPVWPKSVPPTAASYLPPPNPPDWHRDREESGIQSTRRVQWPDGPDGVPSAPTVSQDSDAEITLTEPKAAS